MSRHLYRGAINAIGRSVFEANEDGATSIYLQMLEEEDDRQEKRRATIAGRQPSAPRKFSWE